MNQLNKESESEKENSMKPKAENVWELGDYRSISTMLSPISAHLVQLMDIQQDALVLDIACGNGNTAITAGRKGANTTGIDITSDLLALAAEEAQIAQVDGITWKEGDAQNLPFEDESFDVVLSSFGHMFAPQPDLVSKEMIRVTKKGGRIGFATWPPELAIGSIFRVNSKYLPKNPNAPPSPILWGIPEVIKERLDELSDIYFERGTTIFPMLSLNHFWEFMSTKYGPLLKTIQILKNPDSANQINLFRDDFLRAINPYVVENGIRLGYLLTVARK
ncbi:class I SAM-dependent methyltransferase [Candidatus Nitrosocosmicus arcticus]|uniref:Methylase involved in ubiquinone/menaquinone biosynthesis n=1 Tax=Candidatus Nitrosocosmicus arcticus TaxID=2035267 RepID=A0A557SQY0_9ARCH|nr:class I SAM-dependent methyltransferase [Candidatus Nitrosocosmicus arcticus]TVP39005.1 Methylase involved in ubiquinone/menaquinone biosynthesis [Candidatus Nitrosocosmicus arcticus]